MRGFRTLTAQQKGAIIFAMCMAAIAAMSTYDLYKAQKPHWSYDPQVAAGEWTVYVQTMPCDTGHLDVVMPEHAVSGDVLTIKCSNITIGER